jgi:hypothetical protein
MSVGRHDVGPGFVKEEKESSFFGISIASENKKTPIPAGTGSSPFPFPGKTVYLVFRVWHVS